jgi:RNA polymerase sigma-70 factor (ECF subfamily)
MTLPQERELLLRIQSDPNEFGTLFDHYYRPVFGYIYRRTGKYALSKDITAETFLKAFLKINAFVWKDISISFWLFRIATNEVNQFFRKKKYQSRLAEYVHETGLCQPDSEEERLALETEMKAHEDFILIQKNLKLLKLHYQEVIALRYFESKEIAEISVILDKPEGTVKSLISRGLEKLRGLMTS